MSRGVLILLACAAAVPVLGDPRAKSSAAVLVEQLGSDDYFEREAATERLAALGPAALPDLRAGCRSPDPEVAGRSRRLVAAITRRADNERTLAPTMVELSAEGRPLAAVLADLSARSGYDVVVGGAGAAGLAAKAVTARTGRVSFWEAVRAVADAAGLQIAAVGVDPVPRRASERPLTLDAPRPHNTVVLEARPWAGYGAVCVEALPVPAGAADRPAPSALLRVWAEPRLGWRKVSGVPVTRAADDNGQFLRPAPFPSAPPWPGADAGADRPELGFEDAVRRAVVTFRPGAVPSARLREFAGSVFGVVRTPARTAAAAALTPGRPVTAAAPDGAAVLTATLVTRDGAATYADVSLAYDPDAVQPVSFMDPLGGKADSAVLGNHTVYGVRATDERGNAYAASTPDISIAPDAADGRRVVRVRMKMYLVPAVSGAGEPKSIEFWGSSDKQVEIPFVLRDVPLVENTR